ncbi:hypothetical protein Tco_0164048 [Tanacetum coccineum]
MTHDLPPEVHVRFINGTDEVAYKMPHKIEQYDSLSDLEQEHTKLVIFDERKLWKFLGSFIGRFSEDDLISFRIFKMQRFKRCQSSVTSSEMKPSMGFIDEEIVNRNWKHNTVQLAKIREVLLRKNASSTEQPVRTGTKQ